jgi:uncharacterized damage-inducible protein DinB
MNASRIEVSRGFLDFSRHKLIEQQWPRLRNCVATLTVEQVWWRPNRASNSIGNLLLHLNGNVGQWLVASFNGAPDLRDRPAEFGAPAQFSASVLLEKLDATLRAADQVLARLTEAELSATYQIQGQTVSGLYAVYQVIEHFSMHYGQILYIVKSLVGADLGFYAELNQTGRAS